MSYKSRSRRGAELDSQEVLVRSEDLEGEALAWAAAALWRVPAMILSGRVHVEVVPGMWSEFDPSAMLRSLIAGHVDEIAVPLEIAPKAVG